MAFETVWQELLDRAARLDAETVLVTPDSGRAFRVEATRSDRIVVRFAERDETRPLWRDQFEVLADRLEGGDDVSLADLPAGVEPYVSVLSLAARYVADEDEGVLRRADPEEVGERESPFLRPGWVGRTRPERVHDDAVLLADLLGRHDLADPESLPVERLVDLYVLLSDVQRGADRLRRSLGQTLLEYVGPDARLRGQFGTVTRTERERRHPKDDETVLAALDEQGIPHEWVMGVDPEKLDVVLAVTDLEEDEVYDVEESVYVQKTDVAEAEKQSRLQGLVDRLEALEAEALDEDERKDLREEIETIEDRLDDLLAAG